LNDMQAVRQTPAEEIGVSCRHNDAGSVELRGGSYQCLDIPVELTDGMCEIPKSGGISRDSAMPLDNECRALPDRVPQLAGSTMAVHAFTNAISRGNVGFCCGADGVAFRDLLDRRTLHYDHQVASIKPKLGVERQRAIMKGRLQQPDAWKTPLARPVHNGQHQRAPDTPVLNLWLNRHRPDAGDRGAF